MAGKGAAAVATSPRLLRGRIHLAHANAGGGLMVAVIQLAVALGATAGGVIYDRSGYASTFAVSAAALCASALLAGMGWRQARWGRRDEGGAQPAAIDRPDPAARAA
jgi:predicted MFS family arabinose efflux permease